MTVHKQYVSLVAILSIVAVSAHAQQPAAATPAAPRPATPAVQVGQKDGFFTTKDGVKIHYLTHGDSGSWVVLVHGYSDNAQRMWFNTGIAPEIAKRHRVVAIDNRNHGQSDKPQPGGIRPRAGRRRADGSPEDPARAHSRLLDGRRHRRLSCSG